MVNVVYLACVTCVRFSHAGQVCSGDYLYYPVSLETRESGILGIEGQFLFVFIIAGWVQFAIMLVVIFVGLCQEEGKNSPNKERDMWVINKRVVRCSIWSALDFPVSIQEINIRSLKSNIFINLESVNLINSRFSLPNFPHKITDYIPFILWN